MAVQIKVLATTMVVDYFNATWTLNILKNDFGETPVFYNAGGLGVGRLYFPTYPLDTTRCSIVTNGGFVVVSNDSIGYNASGIVMPTANGASGFNFSGLQVIPSLGGTIYGYYTVQPYYMTLKEYLII